jgi:hypothetical protein
MLPAEPLEVVVPPARLGTPVMLPGRRLEIPLDPVMKRLVGIGTPLTGAALPPPGPLLPNDPAPELFAPGNGVISAYPLDVRMMIPRLGVASSARSSRIHSVRSGRNLKPLFIFDAYTLPCAL